MQPVLMRRVALILIFGLGVPMAAFFVPLSAVWVGAANAQEFLARREESPVSGAYELMPSELASLPIKLQSALLQAARAGSGTIVADASVLAALAKYRSDGSNEFAFVVKGEFVVAQIQFMHARAHELAEGIGEGIATARAWIGRVT